MGDTWEDGDSSNASASEPLYLPNEGRNGKAEMAGKAGNGLRLAMTIYNEKRGDEMRRRDNSFREKPANSGSPTETSGTDWNVECFFLLHGTRILLKESVRCENQRGREVRASFQRTNAKTKQISAAIQRPFFSRKSEHFCLMAGPASGRKMAKRRGTIAGKRDRKVKIAKAETLARLPLARVI